MQPKARFTFLSEIAYLAVLYNAKRCCLAFFMLNRNHSPMKGA